MTGIDTSPTNIKNTWSDWGLVAKERPFIAPPTPKTNFIDIPGASSKLDFSDALTKYPTYENRTGSIEFTITRQYLSGQEQNWQYIYTEIMTYISGRHLIMVLEDDPNFFYEGRFYVESYKPGASAADSFSTITINYDVGPYKWTLKDSLDDDWLWGPFSFVDGVILSSKVKDIRVTTSWQSLTLDTEELGVAPFCPEFVVTSQISGNFVNLEIVSNSLDYTIDESVPVGTTRLYDCILWSNVYIPNGTTVLRYKTNSSTAFLSLKYRRGGL
jgi:hypothetical protein